MKLNNPMIASSIPRLDFKIFAEKTIKIISEVIIMMYVQL
jgi:hypothetical protein